MFPKLTALRFAPPVNEGPVSHDRRLDSLRGFAACSVMAVHGFGNDGHEYAAPLSAPNEYVRHLHMSRAAVLLFFIISGYVIGLTNKGTYSRARAGAYLRKRCLRIVPLYLIAIFVGWLACRSVSPGNLLANALFLQNAAWGIPPISGNLPVWSLHYEVAYYLGFLLLWAWRPRVLPLVAVMLLLAVNDWFLAAPCHFSAVGLPADFTGWRGCYWPGTALPPVTRPSWLFSSSPMPRTTCGRV